MKSNRLYLLFLLIVISTSVLSNEVIIMNKPFSDKDPRNDYAHELLNAALLKTINKYGSFELKDSIVMNEERAKTTMLLTGYGDVIQAATRKNWETKLIPIRIPILKGMMGKRVFLINKKMQKKFNAINSLDELKQIPLGSGHIWAITKVFKDHGFNVMTGTQYDSMFKMLKRGRFDYFPRGLNEILTEYQLRSNDNPELKIEESILLQTSLPVYFFVNPSKPQLAKRIHEGLNTIIKNGSFDLIFEKHFNHVYDQLNIKNRKVFNLNNNNLALK